MKPGLSIDNFAASGVSSLMIVDHERLADVIISDDEMRGKHAFFALSAFKPNTLVMTSLGLFVDRHRRAAGFQNNYVAGFEFHDLKLHTDFTGRSVRSSRCHVKPLVAS